MEEKTTQAVTTRAAGVRYGLILGAFSIILFIIYSLAHVDMTGKIRFLIYPFIVVAMVLAHKYFKDNGNGYMSYGQGMGIVFWLCLISSALSSVFTYFYIKVIDNAMVQMIKDKQMEEMQAKGMSDEQMEQAMKFASIFTSPEAIFVFGIVFGIIGGILIGLLVTIFTQKKNPQPTF